MPLFFPIDVIDTIDIVARQAERAADEKTCRQPLAYRIAHRADEPPIYVPWQVDLAALELYRPRPQGVTKILPLHATEIFANGTSYT